MPRPERSPTRFYALLDPLRLECPACGRLICFGPKAPDRKCWSRLASELTCPDCGRIWTLGIKAYLRPRSAIRLPPDVPPDQRLRPDQLLELRLLYGMGTKDARRKGQPVNERGESCTCWPETFAIGCPVHDGSVRPKSDGQD